MRAIFGLIIVNVSNGDDEISTGITSTFLECLVSSSQRRFTDGERSRAFFHTSNFGRFWYPKGKSRTKLKQGLETVERQLENSVCDLGEQWKEPPNKDSCPLVCTLPAVYLQTTNLFIASSEYREAVNTGFPVLATNSSKIIGANNSFQPNKNVMIQQQIAVNPHITLLAAGVWPSYKTLGHGALLINTESNIPSGATQLPWKPN